MTKPAEYYANIIRREFAKAMSCDPSAVHVDIPEGSEMIIVDCDFMHFVCDCDDDENFVFVGHTSESDVVITFPIPADYLEI